jgi:hypothetical protein
LQDPIQKVTAVKRAEGMAQVVENLSSKSKALSSNLQTPVLPKKKKKNIKKTCT